MTKPRPSDHSTSRAAARITAGAFLFSAALLGAALLAGCSSSGEGSSDCPTITLATHDSFALSDQTLDSFTKDTCITVEVTAQGDTGQLVSSAILTAGNPVADVLFGIDSTFMSRGLANDLFVPYTSPGLATVDEDLRLDPTSHLTPIDYSDVCINYWKDAVATAPSSIDDLTNPIFADELVVQHPETSSPGLAFLLATVAIYGEDGWQDYWASLRDNGVAVATSWTDSYYGEFVAGGGERAMVVSYASSPPAEVVFADPPADEPPTAVVGDSCYRQVEFAGILAGTEHLEAAQRLIDFMLDETYQSDIALNQFVYPANRTVALPEVFTRFGQLSNNPVALDPDVIEAGRDRWTQQWVDIVLR